MQLNAAYNKMIQRLQSEYWEACDARSRRIQRRYSAYAWRYPAQHNDFMGLMQDELELLDHECGTLAYLTWESINGLVAERREFMCRLQAVLSAAIPQDQATRSTRFAYAWRRSHIELVADELHNVELMLGVDWAIQEMRGLIYASEQHANKRKNRNRKRRLLEHMKSLHYLVVEERSSPSL